MELYHLFWMLLKLLLLQVHGVHCHLVTVISQQFCCNTLRFFDIVYWRYAPPTSCFTIVHHHHRKLHMFFSYTQTNRHTHLSLWWITTIFINQSIHLSIHTYIYFMYHITNRHFYASYSLSMHIHTFFFICRFTKTCTRSSSTFRWKHSTYYLDGSYWGIS